MLTKVSSVRPPAFSDLDGPNARCRSARILFFLCLLFLLASCAATPQGGGSKATLWKMQGEHNTLYLLGSIHVLSKQAYPLKPALEHAFNDASQVVFEIDLTRFTQRNFKQEFSRTAYYPPGQTLSKKLAPETIDLLNGLLPLYGLSLKKVQQIKTKNNKKIK